MANDPLITVEGGRQLRATMRAAGMDMQRMKDAHAATARVAQQGITAKAPKKSGAMAATVRSSGTMSYAVVRAGFKSRPYAGPNNWGWPANAGGIRGSFGGDHWMYAGARATESAWVAVYAAEVQKIANTIRGK